ncbi:hypothetical protein [Sutcliffiella horikoshii]|uniref:hypothetical protein n=1 Tax=Sutcliffiella horikoshii TaxID=79883 RepID=UPI003850DAF2
MTKKYYCKNGNHYVNGQDYYHQGKVCKKCRNEININKIGNLTGIELAKHLLHKSCIRAIERVRRNEKQAYIGVKCDWTKPSQMKKDLMSNKKFWGKWLEQSRLYEEKGKKENFRPTIDRIESDPNKEGHYTMENIQVLSHSENSFKANSVKCKVILIRGLEVVSITEYESIKTVMKELGIRGYNVINLINDSGKIQSIGDDYSVLIQTFDGTLKKQETPLYKGIITKQKIIVDYETGKEYIINSSQYSFDSYGIWFGENKVMA